jgi:hypothetical protein
MFRRNSTAARAEKAPRFAGLLRTGKVFLAPVGIWWKWRLQRHASRGAAK